MTGEWVTQTRPGGVILTDLKTSLIAGSLVRLTRYPDRAEGHFDRTYAAFMGLRHHPAGQGPASPPRPRRQRGSEAEHRTTTLDPRTPWTSLLVWFLASFDGGSRLSKGVGSTVIHLGHPMGLLSAERGIEAVPSGRAGNRER
jgi:hypothetical protein